MAVNVTFRVVGLYCYFKNMELSSVDPDSKVEQIMDAIREESKDFDYDSIVLPSGKKLVNKISYVFGTDSEQPPNAGVPAQGLRSEEIVLGPISLVWQYYRTATVEKDGKTYEIKIITPGQPSYADTPLDKDVDVPEGFNIRSFNLTWRLVKIEMSPENMKNYMNAKAAGFV